MNHDKNIIRMIAGSVLVGLFILPTLSGAAQPTATETSAPTDIGPFWGPIFYAKCKTDYELYYDPQHARQILAPCLRYTVIGFGNHYIQYSITYNLSFYGTTIWENQTYVFDDFLYFIGRPLSFFSCLMTGFIPWKFIAHNEWRLPRYNISGGSWAIKLTIDRGKYVTHADYVYG